MATLIYILPRQDDFGQNKWGLTSVSTVFKFYFLDDLIWQPHHILDISAKLS